MRGKQRMSKPKRTRAESAAAAKMLRRLREGADARNRKIRRIGAAIRADHYENDLKFQIAVDRMMADLSR
jgi:hypothetical protein